MNNAEALLGSVRPAGPGPAPDHAPLSTQGPRSAFWPRPLAWSRGRIGRWLAHLRRAPPITQPACAAPLLLYQVHLSPFCSGVSSACFLSAAAGGAVPGAQDAGSREARLPFQAPNPPGSSLLWRPLLPARSQGYGTLASSPKVGLGVGVRGLGFSENP